MAINSVASSPLASVKSELARACALAQRVPVRHYHAAIITKINQPQKVREVYQTFKTATQANMEVLRAGYTQFIQINMGAR